MGRREVRLYDYRIAPLDFDPGKSECMSALFRNDALRRQGQRMNGRVVQLHVRLCDYFAQAIADPFSATISNMQNECGARYYATIDSIGR